MVHPRFPPSFYRFVSLKAGSRDDLHFSKGVVRLHHHAADLRRRLIPIDHRHLRVHENDAIRLVAATVPRRKKRLLKHADRMLTIIRLIHFFDLKPSLEHGRHRRHLERIIIYDQDAGVALLPIVSSLLLGCVLRFDQFVGTFMF